MAMQNISLNSIKIFVVAARYLSFKRAAEQLHVTPGAISRQIRSLEQQLAVPLFRRRHREVQLTAAGVDYLNLVKPALAEIDGANQLLLSRSKQHNLKIQTSPTFALHWLIPRLASFKQQYPEIQIEIATSSFSIDPDSVFNLYIRRDPGQFSDLKHWPFMVEYCQFVCTQSVLQDSDNVKQLLQNVPLITYKTRPGLWQKWFDEVAQNYSKKEQDISFENTIFAIQAAVEGLGVALIPQVFLTDFLRSNALVIPFAMEPIATGSYHLLSQNGSLSSTEQLFLDWLQTQGISAQ